MTIILANYRVWPPSSVLDRILPNPVALLLVEERFSGDSSIVLFVPADGVKHELASVGAAVFVGLTGERVVGHL